MKQSSESLWGFRRAISTGIRFERDCNLLKRLVDGTLVVDPESDEVMSDQNDSSRTLVNGAGIIVHTMREEELNKWEALAADFNSTQSVATYNSPERYIIALYTLNGDTPVDILEALSSLVTQHESMSGQQ
ncbi:hypothetical protein KBB49_00300 [Candidatus Saccharibacteria bacterium]|nr:hypothetical protein [Candidatus Saccharibacteria bacterium]